MKHNLNPVIGYLHLLIDENASTDEIEVKSNKIEWMLEKLSKAKEAIEKIE